MIDAGIYLKAAKRIISRTERITLLDSENDKHNICCCDALYNADYENIRKTKRDFADMFKDVTTTYWWANPFCTDEDQEARKLALLFMYEIAKEGLDDKR